MTISRGTADRIPLVRGLEPLVLSLSLMASCGRGDATQRTSRGVSVRRGQTILGLAMFYPSRSHLLNPFEWFRGVTRWDAPRLFFFGTWKKLSSSSRFSIVGACGGGQLLHGYALSVIRLRVDAPRGNVIAVLSNRHRESRLMSLPERK